MEVKEPRLEDIYKSIHNSINIIQEHLGVVRTRVGDVEEIDCFARNILKPLCASLRLHKLDSLESLKVLLTLHQTSPRPGNVALTRKASDHAIEQKCNITTPCNLPPVFNAQSCVKGRSFLPSSVRYPAIKPSLTRNHCGRRCVPKLVFKPTPPIGKVVQKPNLHEVKKKNEDNDKKKEELSVFLDRLELATSKLQKTFTLFSQRVLVPLQTFCKVANLRLPNRIDEEKTLPSFEKSDDGIPSAKTPDGCELFMVGTMNKIKLLLWTHADTCFDPIFSRDGFSKKVATAVDCGRFPVLRLLPDALQKFDAVVKSALDWLKRDEIVTESARNGLERAHRRYVKTEKLWKEARCSERRLRSEFNQRNFEIDASTLRLESLQSDIEILQEDLQKREDQWRTAEVVHRDSDDSTTDCTNVLVKAHQKRIACLKKKIETKERSFKVISNRIQTRKADQNTLQEKVLTCKGSSESLQKSLINLYHRREAWRKRYFDRTDPKLLKRKLENVGLRIPMPTVREKTFILKTRMENLLQATEIVSDRLRAHHIPWSTLCRNLTWPNHFLLTLQNMNGKTKRKFSIDDGFRSESPESSNPDEKTDDPFVDDTTRSGLSSSPVERVIDYVKRSFKGTEKDRCLFMLRLWLQCSGRLASLDQLVNALQLSRLGEAAFGLLQLETE